MPKLQYERLRGIDFGVSRTVACVAVPWFETGKRSITPRDAELVCQVCHAPETLTLPVSTFALQAKQFSELLRNHPAEVGELIRRVGEWRDKQTRSQAGLARRLIEIAKTRYPDEPLSYELLGRISKAEGIDIGSAGKTEIRRALTTIRKEVEEMERNTPKATDEQIAAQLAEQGLIVRKKARKRTLGG